MKNTNDHQQSSMHRVEFPDLGSHPDFVAMEKERLEHWYRDGVVERYLHKNDTSEKKFSFLDGPITANNPMGVHHGRGRTYKDLWQRYFNMKGCRERFQNGFDCQGLWVEVEVEKELGFKNKKDIMAYGVEKFVEKCKERVRKYSAIQTEQSKRLGMFMDWEHSYVTMSDENNYAIWQFLKVCHERGWIYKGHDSVPWCPRCETAISQHEMLTEDYKTVTHKAIYLELPVVGKKDEFLLIWTTTPWTIPANIAVAVEPKLEYSLVEGSRQKRFWVATETVERVFTWGGEKVLKTVKGSELVGMRYRGPFDEFPAVRAIAQEDPEKFHTVVASDPLILPVTTTEGTGLIHTAVSAGTEDFKLGQKLGLPMIPVIADDAAYLEGFDFLTGQNAKKHPELIFEYLLKQEKEKKEDWVFLIHDYTHRYPGCWRCKTELVWKVTDEWYIAMDKSSRNSKLETRNSKGKEGKINKTLREQMMEVTKKIHWIPTFGLERELDWLTNMHDWLISKKNRFWGLALPIYECKKCGWFDVIGGKEELKKRAVRGWEKFEGHTPHKPFIDEVKIECPNCHEMVSRIEPVGNPWLDAGIVPFSTLPPSWFPANFITEAFPGQFKNWFYSMIVMSTVLKKTNPFETVLGYETVVGEDGRPMHKSWGNAIDFNDGAEKIGVDVMRWMYAKTPPTSILPFGYKTGDEIRRRFLLILWNGLRFFLTNVKEDKWGRWGKKHPGVAFTPAKHILDTWILSRLEETIRIVTLSLNRFDASTATETLESFVNDFSTWYIRRSRDRVGPTVADGEDKDLCYRQMLFVLKTLSRLLAPFIPYLSDFMYCSLGGHKESVHLSSWPNGWVRSKLPKKEVQLLQDMSFVRDISSAIHAERKHLRIPSRQPLASATITMPQERLGRDCVKVIEEETNVKSVVFKEGKLADIAVDLDTTVTDALRQEGKAREIVRGIQDLRKKSGTSLSDQIIAYLPDWPSEWEGYIKRETLTCELRRSDKPRIEPL